MIHETLSGRRLECDDPSGELATFLGRLSSAVTDPAVTEDAFVALLYGRENPILDRSIFADRGAVTAQVTANPLWYVMTDLLGRKQVALGRLDVDAAAARFTLSVADTAARLGISESAVRQAIESRRLPAWRKGGKWFIDPRAADAFMPGKQGPERATVPALEVRVGLLAGASLRLCGVDTSALERDSLDTKAWAGQLREWESIGVLWSHGDKARFFRLVPGGEPAEIANQGLFVRGRFTIAETDNNARRARARFAEHVKK